MKRFFDKINKTDSCWVWKASLRCGYGAFKYNGKTIGAHVFSYQIHKGEIPERMCVCHTCDNPSCVNPDHLFLGSYSDNMKDAFNKSRIKVPEGKRFNTGHTPKNASISREEANKIKEAILNRDTSLKNLSIQLGYPHQLLRDISCGRIYGGKIESTASK